MSTALAPSAAASYLDRTKALDAFQSISADEAVGSGWTGSVAGCRTGTESTQSLSATLHTVNVLRQVAGLGAVTLDADLNEGALAAALMVRALGGIDHDPGQSSPCYSKEGARTSGESNLYDGLSGAEAIVGYVEDPGVTNLSHRRWLLDPAAEEFGSGSTGTTNALKVVGSHRSGRRASAMADDQLVTWPAAGWFPTPWMFKAWSVSIGNGSNANLSSARIKVTLDGSPVPVSDVRQLSGGSGTGKTLGWQTSMPAGIKTGDHQVAVSIAGVKIGGDPKAINYTVSAFDPSDRNVAPAPPLNLANPVTSVGRKASKRVCSKKLRSISKARKKLRKARRAHRRRAIRKAKKNLKGKKRAHRITCR